MSDLLLRRTAVFDGPGEMYRIELGRMWDDLLPVLVVCMLNPSWASHLIDDQTILVLMHFARSWGFGGLRVVNLYPFRSPKPSEMKRHPERQSASNRTALEEAMVYAALTSGRLLVAWGNDGNFEGEADWFASRAAGHHGLELICLGRTQDGSPKHPMARGVHRIPRDQLPIVWRKA